MKLKSILGMASTVAVGITMVACTPSNAYLSSLKTEVASESLSKGQKYEQLLASKDWQGTKVYDANGKDLTKENSNFIGLAKYDANTGFYEFFDKETGETRGDEGTYFVTNDGSKRILISATKKYQAIVDITEINDKKFTYKRMGKDAEGKDVEVFVEHIPYAEKKLHFTKGRAPLHKETGVIDTSKRGSEILGATLWNGTIVLDASGNDVTEANQMFISLAKFDDKTSKYEFFNINTGESRGDFGYFDVLSNNKIRSHVSIEKNKYAAVLEITEINNKKFTYKRMGKNAEGKEVEVFVEHEPYQGNLKPMFSF